MSFNALFHPVYRVCLHVQVQTLTIQLHCGREGCGCQVSSLIEVDDPLC